MCMLELSKVPIYEFHYDYIKNKYGNKLRLFLINNYSFVYEIETKNVYADFSKNKENFNFSNHSLNLKYYNDSNTLAFGKIRDETGGDPIEELVGSKLKMYSVLVSDS